MSDVKRRCHLKDVTTLILDVTRHWQVSCDGALTVVRHTIFWLPWLQVMEQAEIIAEAIARDDAARCRTAAPAANTAAKAAVFELAHKVGSHLL